MLFIIINVVKFIKRPKLKIFDELLINRDGINKLKIKIKFIKKLVIGSFK